MYDIQLQNRQWLPSKLRAEVQGLTYQKKETPQTLDQFRGDRVSGPDQLDIKTQNKIEELYQSITSQNVCSLQIQHDVEGSGNMPQIKYGLWEEKDPSIA